MDNTQILVVEDDGAIAENIHRKLNSAGYSVLDMVMSGEEAVAKAQAIQREKE